MSKILTRRKLIHNGSIAALSGSLIINSAKASDTPLTGLKESFFMLDNALATGDLETFYNLIHDDAIIIDEDIPFRLSKSGFKDHIGFHIGGVWESFSWQDRNPKFRVFGNTGIVASHATFRGKPVDAGYRQRHMAFTQGWHKFDSGWKIINWHQSPFDGHILEASPG